MGSSDGGSSDGPITTTEEFVAATERDGVEFLFAMFVDMHGKPCAKMVPDAQAGRVARR